MVLILMPLVGAAMTTPAPRAPDYQKLYSRLASQKTSEATVDCILLDAMLPRQRITMQFGPPVSESLRAARAQNTYFAVVGMDHREQEASGGSRVLRVGVEARVESMSAYQKNDGFFSSHSTSPWDAPNMRGYQALDTTLCGGRRFEILEPAIDDAENWPPATPVFKARVRWLPEESSTAAAIVKASEIPPLVSEWLELVRNGKRERAPGQMDAILADIGAMPQPEEADDLALWVAALVNPIPSLGVCKEIRPKVLEARDVLTRVSWAHAAISDSIARCKRNPPGPFEVEAPPPWLKP